MIEFIIGNTGNDNVDSWAFLRAGSFLCVAVGGGVDSGATMMTKGGGGAGDSAATSSNVSKMDTSASATWYTSSVCRCHPHLSRPTHTFVASDQSNFLQQMHNIGMTLSYEHGGARKSRGPHPTINRAVGGCVHCPGATRPRSRHRDIRPWAHLFFFLLYANVLRDTLSPLAHEKYRKWMDIHTGNTKMNM
jgi:hypothetical protein